jgi:hypothetical protein
MKTQDIAMLGNKLTAFLSDMDMDHVRDALLSGANLQRRRPVLMSASAVGLVGLGAIAALAVVAFVPSVRNIIVGNAKGFANQAKDFAGQAKSDVVDAKDSIVDEAKHVAGSVTRTANNGARDHKIV